jgi:hypothetical protein
LLFAVVATLLALPFLMLDSVWSGSASGASLRVNAAGLAPGFLHQPQGSLSGNFGTLVTAPPTTAPPPTAPPVTAPPTTAAPKPKPKAKPKPVTTITAAPPTTAAPDPGPPLEGNAEEGGASWYDSTPGGCAHRSLPFGTVVTITNLATGATATCTVNDRGPYGAGRIIDLDRSVFAQLADPSAGVINARISW